MFQTQLTKSQRHGVVALRNQAALSARALGQKGLRGQCAQQELDDMQKWMFLVETFDTMLAKNTAPLSLFFSETQKRQMDSMRTSLRCKAASASLSHQTASMKGDFAELSKHHIVAQKAAALIALIDMAIGPPEQPTPKPVAKAAPARPRTYREIYDEKVRQWEAAESRR